MQCRQCQHENRSSARHCAACGTPMFALCAACGTANPPDSRYCDDCGAPLGSLAAPEATERSPRAYTPQHLAQKILTSRSALEGERKQVTVLFCDMANSTELAQRLGADAMHRLLNQFFELALAEIHRMEGTINQFLGDGLMALFGAPVAHEDHVRRALLAALAVQQRLKEMAAATEGTALGQVRVRMGLNTGTVVVGSIGDNLRMDYTAVGDTTNIAARLQSLALPGQICVSEGVMAQGQAHFEFMPLGHHPLKGIKDPVAVHALVRARPRGETDARSRSLGIGSPLVGRDADIAAVMQELDALVDNGRGGILVLAGEPGVGKSRLVAEVRRRRGAGEMLWLEGRAVSFGRSLSYLPFIEILKNLFEIADEDGEERSWHQLEQGLTRLFGERAAELLPYLGAVLALPVPPELEERVKYLDGQSLGRQVFLCMRQLFEQVAARQPVVLMLEDWHWADQSSVELAEHLLPLTRSSALLACFASRPDPHGPVGNVRAWAEAEPGVHLCQRMLAPLSDTDGAALVANLVGPLNLPATLRDEILHKTDGNPFFIEEVIRSLVADGVLVRAAQQEGWALAAEAEHVHIPDTIQGVLQARIDRLEDDVKQALKLASVIGRSFFNRVLEVIHAAPRELSTSVARLEHAELIRQRQPLPEIEYIFKHALVHEAAYGSILSENRRLIHGRVAQAIETLFADRLDEFTSLLAHHYTHAEDWDKAQQYLFRAGDQAGRMAADAEALEHFRQAEAAYMRAYGDKLKPLQRATLARKVGAALYGTGHYEQALAQFRRALAQMGFAYPTSRWGVRVAIARHLVLHGLTRLRRRLGLPAGRGLDSELAQEMSTVCHFMSWADYFLNKDRMMLDCQLELYAGEHGGNAVAEARGLSSLGFAFMSFGFNRLARRYHAAAGEVAQGTGNPSATAFASFALGFLDFYDGRWEDSNQRLAWAAATYREAGDIHRRGGAVLMRGWIVRLRGDLPELAAMGAELIRDGRDAADPQLASWGYLIAGNHRFIAGPLDEAIALLQQGEVLAAKMPAWDLLIYQKAMLARCHLMQGRAVEAELALRAGLGIVAAQGWDRPFDKVELLTGWATFKLAMAEAAEGPGRPAALRAARRACQGALRCARSMPGWLPEALRLLAGTEWLAGRAGAAQAHWRTSLEHATASGFPIERARTLHDMGQRTDDAALVEQAVAIYRQHGANNFLGQALTALAPRPAEAVPVRPSEEVSA